MRKHFSIEYWMSFSFACLLLISCSTQRQIGKQANNTILSASKLQPAHIGICIYDPIAKKYLYNHQSDKYFLPASNTKLFTCYAAMKYLGDSIVAAKYIVDGDRVILQATGDPTFLHPDFKQQPLLRFLQQSWIKEVNIHTSFGDDAFGSGWSWSDYEEDYMAERSPFPIFGNVATFIAEGDSFRTIPPYLKLATTGSINKGEPWQLSRNLGAHFYAITPKKGTSASIKTITMPMDKGASVPKILGDTLHKLIDWEDQPLPNTAKTIYSQPTDSLLKIMMHRSDNFFAEQSLLMVSNQLLGVMNDSKIIDTLLKSDLKGLPQMPRWVDGSGLSRYDLFSPQDFVWLLNKMKAEFSFDRIKTILAGADEGTLRGLYKGYEGRVFAKTGTLSNQVGLCGYIITKKEHPLIFSVMVNNHQTSASEVRKSIEAFITSLIDKY
jgi:D-alanyl-D-alanine carboxypeptidase/D-alanyl-D-alanine-endopeptidase (penicillin-binding protein 4)